jgi:nucleotide-binding universal stress UspA family protein
MNHKTPNPPKGLQTSGKALWRAVLAEFDLSPAELRLLHEAGRTTDELDRLAAAMPDASLTVMGSRGQPRPSPLLDEARKHRDTLVRLLTALKEDKK